MRAWRMGQGAAGSVYKAFDLQALELVALKEIPIFDRDKRRQMVLELNSLYRNLTAARGRAKAAAGAEAGSGNVVAFRDAFSNVGDGGRRAAWCIWGRVGVSPCLVPPNPFFGNPCCGVQRRCRSWSNT